jgi:hypothetical protein
MTLRDQPDHPSAAQLADLGESLCTEDEIAGALQITPRALQRLLKSRRDLRLALEAGRARSRAGLRRAQLKLAETNASMAIFLGRMYLAQVERKEAEVPDAAQAAETGRRVRERLTRLLAQAGLPTN